MSDANIMYIIIDTTIGKVWKHEGRYPINIINRIVNKGHTLTVSSTGSNTIKYHNKTIVKNGMIEDIDRDELLYYRNIDIFEEY